MPEKAIVTHQDEGVLWLTLNRPQAMNALTIQLFNELEEALRRADNDDDVRVIVITGSDKAFCAGADLKEVLRELEPRTDGTPDFLQRLDEAFGYLRSYPKPVIAALNGFTLAGGLELAMCCDIVFAAESARIGDAHSNYGLFPGAGGAAVLPKRVGLQRAKFLLFSGDHFPASDWVQWGLVMEVVPDELLRTRVGEFAAKLAEKSPLVLRRMKEVANASLLHTDEDAIRHELLTLRHHLRSYDLNEGLKAFQEKRTPHFLGR